MVDQREKLPSQERPRRSRRTLQSKTVVHWLILTFLLISFQETLFRSIFYTPEVLNFNRLDYSLAQLSPDMKRCHFLSNTAFTWTSDPDGVEFVNTLNEYGFRDKAWSVSKIPTSTRFMFIGDSFVEGIMAEDHRTISRAFEVRAHEGGYNVEAMNFGVGASGIAEYFQLIRDAVPLFKPDRLMLVLYANDLPAPAFDQRWLQDSLVPEFANRWMPRLVHVVRYAFAQVPVARTWTTGTFSFFRGVPDPSNPWSKRQQATVFERFVDPRIADAMKKGRFNPYSINEYDRLEQVLQRRFEIGRHLNELRDYLARFSVELSVAYIPTRSQVSDAYLDYQQLYNENRIRVSLTGSQYQQHALILENTCRKLSISFTDLTPVLREAEESGARLFWQYDAHMNAEGYSLVGRYLCERVLARQPRTSETKERPPGGPRMPLVPWTTLQTSRFKYPFGLKV